MAFSVFRVRNLITDLVDLVDPCVTRFFSQYTVAVDTLGVYRVIVTVMDYLNWKVDPDDLIFPRAATRVGPKYQAAIPPVVDVVMLSGTKYRAWLACH